VRKKASRLAKIADLIEERGIVRAQELADLFNTSRRTIYRDIDVLKDNGFQIEACLGSNGGFRRVTTSKNIGQDLAMEEACALLMAGSMAQENNQLPYAKDLDTALEKILGSLSPKEKAAVLGTIPNVSLVAERITDDEESTRNLDLLTQAISRQQRVGITYYSLYRDRQEPRDIDPYHLCCMKGAWYVIAYCHLREQMRVFRVDRIKTLKVYEVNFQRAASFSLHSYLGSAWSLIKGERHAVRVRFLPPISRFIAESKWHTSQKTEELPDGSLLFTAEIEGLEEFERWVLSYAEHAEVIEPEVLRQSLREKLLKMMSLYS